MASKITATEIRALLREKYENDRQFAIAEEVGNATGLEQKRRLDMVVVDCFRSSGYSIHGFEIKVSKADLRRELQDSSKHNIFFPSIDYFSLAAPADVVDVDIVPKSWGLYLVDRMPDGATKLRTYRKPLSLHDERMQEMGRDFAVCLMRALYNQSPSESQIALAKEEARKEALSDFRRQFDVSRAEYLEKELEAYKELKERFKFWGAGDIKRAMDEFERCRKLNPDSFIHTFEQIKDIASRELKALKSRGNDSQRKE